MSSETKVIKLPSGRTAEFRKPKVRDLLQAHRVTGFSNEPMCVAMALAAEVTLVDGRPIIYEDVLELSAEDGLALQSEIVEERTSGNFPEAPEGITDAPSAQLP
jgi:hypothetical protein